MRNCFWQCCNLVEKAFVVERLIFSLVQNLLHNHQTALAENYYYLKNIKFENIILLTIIVMQKRRAREENLAQFGILR